MVRNSLLGVNFFTFITVVAARELCSRKPLLGRELGAQYSLRAALFKVRGFIDSYRNPYGITNARKKLSSFAINQYGVFTITLTLCDPVLL